jgi:PhnB protein
MTQTITPYLTVRSAADAFAFYKQAFGATEICRVPTEDGQRVLHGAIAVAGGTVFLNDDFPDHGGAEAPNGRLAPGGVAIALPTVAEVEALYASAVAAGAKGFMPPQATFFSQSFAMLDDPFGYRWLLNGPAAAQAAA